MSWRKIVTMMDQPQVPEASDRSAEPTDRELQVPTPDDGVMAGPDADRLREQVEAAAVDPDDEPKPDHGA